MPNLKFHMRPDIIQGGNLSNQGSTDSNVFIEYDNFYPAGTKVSAYRIEAELALSNVTINDDLSVTFTYGGIQLVRAYTKFSTTPVGYQIEKTLFKGDNSIAWKHSDDIASMFDSGYIKVAGTTPKTYTVPANGSISIPEVKAFGWLATGEVSDQCDVYVGGTVTNTIPTYKPNGLRKNGEWKGVVTLSLSSHIRKNGQWIDVGTEDIATIEHTNSGNSRQRQGGQWKQVGPFS